MDYLTLLCKAQKVRHMLQQCDCVLCGRDLAENATLHCSPSVDDIELFEKTSDGEVSRHRKESMAAEMLQIRNWTSNFGIIQL